MRCAFDKAQEWTPLNRWGKCHPKCHPTSAPNRLETARSRVLKSQSCVKRPWLSLVTRHYSLELRYPVRGCGFESRVLRYRKTPPGTLAPGGVFSFLPSHATAATHNPRLNLSADGGTLSLSKCPTIAESGLRARRASEWIKATYKPDAQASGSKRPTSPTRKRVDCGSFLTRLRVGLVIRGCTKQAQSTWRNVSKRAFQVNKNRRRTISRCRTPFLALIAGHEGAQRTQIQIDDIDPGAVSQLTIFVFRHARLPHVQRRSSWWILCPFVARSHCWPRRGT